MRILQKKDIVLELGSGSSPWARSDVLLDRYYIDETGQRGGEDIFVDRRPMVVAAGERLPFKDKAFDFIYCCHVIEHATDIVSMLDEMSRVAKAGFIECPNPLLERILDQDLHHWYITSVGNRLLIAPKTAANNVTKPEDRFYFHLISIVNGYYWEHFVTRLSWTDRISYEVCDDVEKVFSSHTIPVDWEAEVQGRLASALDKAKADLRKRRIYKAVRNSAIGGVIKQMKKWLRMRRTPRITPEKFLSLLACPDCRADLQRLDGRYRCVNCAREFPDSYGVSVLL